MHRMILFTSENREWAQGSTKLPIMGCVQIQAETL